MILRTIERAPSQPLRDALQDHEGEREEHGHGAQRDAELALRDILLGEWPRYFRDQHREVQHQVHRDQSRGGPAFGLALGPMVFNKGRLSPRIIFAVTLVVAEAVAISVQWPLRPRRLRYGLR